MRVLCLAFPGMLPQVRVLADSLRKNEPDWSLEVVTIGSARPDHGLGDDVRVLPLADEVDVDVDAMLGRHEARTLISVIVPRLLQTRCQATGEPWLHLPPTVWVLGRLQPIARLIAMHGILLVPRAADDPPEDGLEPSREQFAMVGRIATELMGVDCSTRAQAFLRWWCDRQDGVLGALEGRPRSHDAEDREWLLRVLQLAPTRFETAVLDDPGSNLSMWNLHQHSLEETSDGIVVDGQVPLRFMDLVGFEPDHPYRLNATSSRLRLSRSPVLRMLASQYADALIQAGWHEFASHIGIGGRLANGLMFDETMSSLYATACELGQEFGDLSTPEGSEAFTAWLKLPIPPWESDGINRYIVHRVIRERPDVSSAFPDLYGEDSERFAAWWRSSGQAEMGADLLLAPSGTAEARSVLAHVEAEPTLPDGLELAPSQTPVTAADGLPLGVRVTGYLGHILGLGSAARGYISALSAADVPLSTVSVPLDHLQAPVELAPEYGRYFYEDVLNERGHAFELMCINADELPHVVERLGDDYFAGPRIGVWGWEVNSIPPRWESAFKLVDEIWVYSRFMAQNIGSVAPVPVVALPPPVQAPLRNRGALRLGVPNGFLFLFIFDYLSTIQRKNPVGLIEAFKSAFSPGEGPRLLVKTINAPLRPDAEEEVLWAAENRPDIHVIDRSLSAEEKDALMLACDCYVSLHRSEGFGLTMAEAMAIGKPVIGTRFSGNVDFMSDDNSLLVDYEITRVGPGVEIYPPDGQWAQPDVEQAARLMRTVYEDPALAARLGARARQDVLHKLSPEATGAAMRRRLEQLAARPRSRARGVK
jgi:glycosyltransferase involved in cell wall biosynthesis